MSRRDERDMIGKGPPWGLKNTDNTIPYAS